MRTLTQAAIDLIKSFEQCRLAVYNDGFGFPTVGWGHRTHLPIGATITQTVADQWLNDDLTIAQLEVERLVTTPLNDNQYGALVSLTFNIGGEAFKNSTLLRQINAGDLTGAPSQIERWCHAGGAISTGLERRRAAEVQLWNTPEIIVTDTDLAT